MKKIITSLFLGAVLIANTSTAVFAATDYREAVIEAEKTVESNRSTIFDASQSFLPDPNKEYTYQWDFGDGNKNEGVEVLHAYKTPGNYTVKLTIDDGFTKTKSEIQVFAYKKLITLITDNSDAKELIEIIRNRAEKNGIFIKIIESFGSSTEFISEEVLTKKLTEESPNIQKSAQIMIWTKENAGLNALSRFIQSNQKKQISNFSQKSIIVIDKSPESSSSRIERQFKIIKPKNIITTTEAGAYEAVETIDDNELLNSLEEKGHKYAIINEKTGKLRPWNFMSHFVNTLVNNGIPDNTIALLLLLPIIATVVAFMKQVVGATTFGIYTPSIITLSFLVIGMHAGLLTLIVAILVGAAVRPVLKKVHMLFIPKMAIVITLVSLTLFLILIATSALGLFNSEFLSIAIFPMLILSTLVEKFVSVKSTKGLSSAAALMASTIIVAIVAYFVVGGEIELGFTNFNFPWVKSIIMSYPELVFLLIPFNIALGKWTGLRVIERIRFREIFRHIEE
ncbi:hypothetical protein COU74_03385 [Candidatus Peregrinibacteria bacterium CG10_big_fil_rev_8_21_14_0_10_36_19]|nr:MAG: hypothetical protein COU74_03385 [Candidatus Peregrinibacteria bacterium CG10_big_fil_rev_8_21_14_0_10_36_19]